jgi:hypothetical protein
LGVGGAQNRPDFRARPFGELMWRGSVVVALIAVGDLLPVRPDPAPSLLGAEKACGEWRVDAFEERQEDEANRVSLREQLITARVGELGNKTLGANFREVIAERGERVVSGAQPSASTTAGWISAVVKVLPAAMCAKRTSTCMRASCRG